MGGIADLVLGAFLLAPASSGGVPEPEPPSAWVANVRIDGDVQTGGRAAFDTAFREGLRRGGLDLRADPTPEPCSVDASCHARAATRANAEYSVALWVTVTRRDYLLSVVVRDSRTGAAVAESREACDVCGFSEATAVADSLAGAVSARLDALALEPPTLAFRSRSPAVLIRVDGEVVGETPFERPLSAGTHIVRAEKEGFVSEERTVEAVPGVSSSLAFELERVPDVLVDPGVRDRRRRWGAVATGVGAAAVVTAVVLVGVHGQPNRRRCAGAEVDQDGDCKFILATAVPGVVVGLVGVGLVATGVTLLVRNRRTRRVALTPGGVRF